ncbi:membrane protein [Ruegeria sp. ANG-S4]|uniref:nickel/cobalt transporter n=1 Tax=Ruegeria sp. ANG-S4 TaxID=1577904 RepID=UPI00057E2567|nr:membrane protein [Ruegeria sp. ANG-S4]KIC43703.1 membrane protein [Ruegeria sp. ANG-S4]
MSRYLIVPVALAFGLLLWLWGSGGFDHLAAWAAGEQREFQNQIARALRATRAEQPQAVATLLTVCFAYGFFHAIGPGHGKVLIGGYGLGRQVAFLRLSAISVLSSLGQAVTAVVLVYTGIFVFQMSRQSLVGATEQVMAPVSYGAIAAIGLWLVFRAVRGFARRSRSQAADHDHTHEHHDHAGHGHSHKHDDGTCSECGHKHGPTAEEVANVGSLREALILIAGIAARPCTGALFVVILTWQMGIAMIGIAGAFAMALGTATVTTLVGWTSFGLRGGLLASTSATRFAAILAPTIELIAGLLIAVVASGLLLRTL